MALNSTAVRPKFPLRNVILTIVFSGMLALLLAELVVRLVLPHPAFYRGHPGNVPGLVVHHDFRGYTWNPGFVGRMTTTDFDNHYEISDQGFRDEMVDESNDYLILAVGDSFTGGEGVEAFETWPKQLQGLLNSANYRQGTTRVINAGVTGYSAEQMRQMAQEGVLKYGPDLVIVGLFPHGVDRIANPFALHGDHLVRSTELKNIRAAEGGYIWYQSEYSNSVAATIDIWCQRYAHFAAYTLKIVNQLSRDGGGSTAITAPVLSSVEHRIEPLVAELTRLDRFLRSRQTQLFVLIVSQQAPDGTFSDDSKAMAQALHRLSLQNRIAAINPLAAFERTSRGIPTLRFDEDAHWTPKAHEIAAKQVADTLIQAK